MILYSAILDYYFTSVLFLSLSSERSSYKAVCWVLQAAWQVPGCFEHLVSGLSFPHANSI